MRILQISKHSHNLKLAHIFSLICFAQLFCMCSWLCDIHHDICAMSKSLLSYFKPVGRDQLVKLPNPTGQLTKELPSSVISAANKDATESSNKESSSKKDHIQNLPQNSKQRLRGCHRELKLCSYSKI